MNDHNNYYENLLKKNVELAGAECTFFADYKAHIIKKLVEKFSCSPDFILDFGCSDGLLTSCIHALFSPAQVTGVDQSSEHIAVARMAYTPINFKVVTTTIPDADATYNVVIASDVFHHIGTSKHAHYLQEIIRVLKPGGLCIVLELNPLNPYTALNFNCNPLEKGVHMLNHWYTQKLLQQYGLVTTQFHYSFPSWFTRLLIKEKYYARIPFGPLYTCTLTKMFD